MTELSTPDTTEIEREIASVPQPAPLNHADRCDTGDCGAQAWVRVVLLDGDLLFCSHHYNQNEAALKSVTLILQDDREKMNVKPSTAAF